MALEPHPLPRSPPPLPASLSISPSLALSPPPLLFTHAFYPNPSPALCTGVQTGVHKQG